MLRVTTWILPGSAVGHRNELFWNLKFILNINFFLPDAKISTSTRIQIQIEFAPDASRYFLNRHFFFARTVLNIHDKELGLILWRQWIKKHPDLASTHFRIHSGFKNFHSGVRTRKVADSCGRKPYPERNSCGFSNIRAPANGAYESVVAFVL